MSAPLVSFLVPCYNQGEFLDEAVDSILAQTIQDFEILIVNDGSTDERTNELLADYRRPRTTVLQTANRGLAGARNLALAHARADYVSAVDADDRLDPRFLERTLQELAADPGLTFCSCWLRAFGDEDWAWQPQRCDLAAVLAEDTVLTASPVRRQSVLEAGGWDAGMPVPGYEDWDLWITLLERGARGTILPEVLFHYRRRRGSMSDGCTSGEAHLRLWSYLVAKHGASYADHRFAVLEQREAEAADLLRGNYRLEGELATLLAPQRRGLEEELARLRQRRSAAAGRHRPTTTPLSPAPPADPRPHLEAELAAARDEVAALRGSWSWRITSPLRALWGWVRR
ncbi:MAG TPA: glycosyltransferase family A protein [Thermoanaerobaculia bacterium]|nr:glycosyltransferase family A protein [Thermoanaerobaculia bacterium]